MNGRGGLVNCGGMKLGRENLVIAIPLPEGSVVCGLEWLVRTPTTEIEFLMQQINYTRCILLILVRQFILRVQYIHT